MSPLTFKMNCFTSKLDIKFLTRCQNGNVYTTLTSYQQGKVELDLSSTSSSTENHYPATYTQIHSHTHTHTRIHTNAHTYTHIYTQMLVLLYKGKQG